MTVQFIDSFDIYGLSAAPAFLLAQKYGGVAVTHNNVKITTGRNGGFALSMGGQSLVTPAGGNHSTWIVGFAFKNTNILNTNFGILDIRDGDTPQITFNFNGQTGLMSALRGNVLLGQGKHVLMPGAWYYLEFKVIVNPINGSIQMRVNTVPDISLNSQVTQVTGNANANAIAIRGTNLGQNASYCIDDLYVLNGAGTENNDFLGDMKVEAVLPVAPGFYTEWNSINGEPNYSSVFDVPEDQDGLYVYTTKPDAVDTYKYGPLSRVVSDVRCVNVNLLARRTDSKDMSIATQVRTGEKDYVGEIQRVPDTAYQYLNQIYENDPATGLPWTVDGVKQAEFGMKFIS